MDYAKIDLEKLQEHLGHELEFVKYGNEVHSLECLKCNEVIWSSDNAED